MAAEPQKNKELEEIFLHIKQLKKEDNNENDLSEKELEPIDIIMDKSNQIAGEIDIETILEDDVFEIVGPVTEDEEQIEETFSKMKVGFGSASICDICGQKIVFEENLAGLVIDNSFFACEKCCQDASKKDLDAWTESKKANPEDVRPIAFWLMQLKNKNRLL